jgi:polyisoprenoid-binding protein YceI
MATSGPLTSPAVRTLLTEASLAGDWILDSARSSVDLKTRHTWGLRPLAGVFHQVSGAGTISPDGEVSGTITVAATSVDTRHKKRDSDLRSGRLFDVDRYPDITFAVDRITPGAEAVTVDGKLTVRDQTRPLSFPVRVTVSGPDEVILDGEARVNRAEFGLTFNPLGMASMENTIVVHAVLTRHPPAA